MYLLGKAPRPYLIRKEKSGLETPVGQSTHFPLT